MILTLALAGAISGCGGATDAPRAEQVPNPQRSRERDRPPVERTLRPPRCPRQAANCRRAGGRVIYVEAVDPDGEGDAHVVLASREGITTSGVTVVDVEPRVRPARLPRPGDWVGAAGPVFRGARGQRQIEATKLVVRRLGR